MSLPKISVRPNTLSAFKGCLLAHAVAAHEATRRDPKHLSGGHWAWPHELYYTHMIVTGYIEARGRLELPTMRRALEFGLQVEKGELEKGGKPELFCEGERCFREIVDKERQAAGQVIVPHRRAKDWIGGPGLAAHATAIGLVNRNDIGRIFEDAIRIGRISHEEYVNALAGGMATALAIAYAVTEGNQPEVIMARLMTTLRSGIYSVPVMLMRKLTLVERLLERKVATDSGINELRSKPRKTVIDVVPGALFAAFNGPRTLAGLLSPLKVLANHKSGMIAASIWGAMHGVDAIPAHYWKGIEDIDSILHNAESLYNATGAQSRG